MGERCFCGYQNTYDHASHHVINSVQGVFGLFVVTSCSVFQHNFEHCNTKIKIKSLGDIILRRANKALGNQEASMAEKFKANLRNHGTNKKRQTTALDVTNKAIGDGHVLKE